MSEEIILPERYKRVSYLADTGLQWIDTEYIPTNNTGLWIDAQQNVHSNGLPMGSGVDTNSPADGFTVPRWLKSTENTAGYAWGGWKSWGRISDGSRFVSSLNFNNDKKALLTTIGETSQSFTGDLTDLSFTPTKSIFLFTTNKDGNPHTYPWQGKIFEAKISEGTTVVRHFIPAYDIYTFRGCMYEVIEGKAYYSKGTSDFTYNLKDIQLGILHKLPEGFTKVNYLIANGFQYIDTNYVPTNETGYYVEGQGYTTSESYFFGSVETYSWLDNNRIYFCVTPNVNWGWMSYGTLTSTAAYLRQETKVSHNFLNSRISKATINETDFTYNLPELNFTPTRNVYLFGVNLADTQNYCGLKGRIDTFLISEGNQIVRQFVPCLDTDGIPCMYELYTGTAHYNQGDGQFAYPRFYKNNPTNLPAGYTKCVYLQSDGTQWIDTQFIANENTGLYLKALHLNNGNYIPFGSGESGKVYYAPRFNTSSKQMAYSYGLSGVSTFYYDKGDDLIYTSTMNLYNDKTVTFISEDTKWSGILSNAANATSYSLWLFSWNKNTGSIDQTNGKFGGRIFRAKITQNDTLIHDFVPCLDVDNRPCMYDLITQEAYYNQSGGTEFAYCVEHQLPSDFIKLKYLESTGTQYIKTGYVPTNTTGIYVDAYNNWATKTTYTMPIGLRETNGNTYIFVGRVLRESTGAGYGWGAVTTPGGTGNVRYEASLNFLNDRQSIITAPAFAQRINALGDLSFTPTIDLCMFGYHNYDGKYYSAGYRLYRAKISEGSEIVRDWVPAYDKRIDKPCMYDLINNVAYYNDGTGEFLTNRNFEGTYTGFTGLGCIGNKLGSDYNPVSQVALPYGYTKADFLESTGVQYIKTELYPTGKTEFEIMLLFKTVNYNTHIFGAREGWLKNQYSLTAQPELLGVRYENVNNMFFVNSAPKTNVKISASFIGNKGVIDTEEFDVKRRTFNCQSPLYVFGGSQMGEIHETRLSGRIYYFNLYESGDLILRFIPAIDPSGVPCMYDTVTDRPFYNDGTGQFKVGMKTLSQAISLRLPETGGTLQLSLPTNDNVVYYEEKIRANNPSWNFTFSYH